MRGLRPRRPWSRLHSWSSFAPRSVFSGVRIRLHFLAPSSTRYGSSLPFSVDHHVLALAERRGRRQACMMDRRTFIASLAASLAGPLAARAQTPARVPHVGILFDGLPLTPEQQARSPLAQGLRELGWVPGETIILERVYTEGRPERLAELAAELVRRKVDVIWCNAPPPTMAAARATTTIPIVFWGVAQPVLHGLIDSF